MVSHILVADILGFSQLVSNLDHNQLDERMAIWITLVEEVRNETEIPKLQLISDTIFVREEGTSEGLERLIQFSKRLLERSLEQHLPIRGAITRGDLTWGNPMYGKALNRAHKLEREQEWIGIACEADLPSVPWSWDLVCSYPVPRKTGPFQRIPAVVWSIPDRQHLVSQCTGKGLLPSGKMFGWELHAKLNNTFVFSKYLEDAKARNVSPQHYEKFWSVELI